MSLEKILSEAPEGATHCTDTTPSMNLYAKVEHLGGFYLRICNRWESYPLYSVIHLLDDLREIQKLRSENEALKSQLVEVVNGATGKTPCARYCEARATQIEMRNMRSELEALKAERDKLIGLSMRVCCAPYRTENSEAKDKGAYIHELAAYLDDLRINAGEAK